MRLVFYSNLCKTKKDKKINFFFVNKTQYSEPTEPTKPTYIDLRFTEPITTEPTTTETKTTEPLYLNLLHRNIENLGFGAPNPVKFFRIFLHLIWL